MKRALFGILLFGGAVLAGASGPPHGVVEAVRAAEAAYAAGRYDEAVAGYRQALDSGWASADLYYNAGCASFKAGQIGWAVAYLEEARRLAPRDPDIRHNLRIASARGRDLLPEEEPSWFLGVLAGVLDGIAPRDFIRVLLILIWVGAAALIARWLAPPIVRRGAGWALWVVAAVAALTAGGIGLKAYQITSAPSGVVVAAEARVLSGPQDGETVQFVLHEGTLLHLGRWAGDWREVWLSEEMRGWLPVESVVDLHGPRWFR